MLKETDFELTKETKNLNIQGTLKLFHVVKIPLDELKYNRLNDRIATWISEYENEHGDGEFPEDQEEFNSIIEDFIYNSNTKQLNKTKTSIKNFDQMEAAVVLSNGIIVDGNRRFTALRKLSRDGEGQRFNYLKAVIIPNEQYTSKEIKTMELNLQHAKENPVDYDPIDNLVGIYRELVGPDKQYNPKEYAHEVDEKESVIKKYMAVSQLMVDYLEYIHRPKQFYIARQQKLDGPLNEVYRILKSKKIDPEDLNDVKDVLFASMLVLDGDVTRRVRDLKGVVENKDSLDSLMDDIDEDLDRVEDSFDDADEEINESNEKEIKKTVEIPDDIRKSLNDKVENQINRKRIDDAQNVPIAKLNQSFNYISDVNPSAVSRMNEKDIDTIKKLLNQIDQQVKAIKEVL
ncbi:hypothetical protein [Companilactobacillus sp. HBUAS59544]|uniref:hypothetical protein n=1 Tax=Companilactobacillus sp. HBUAS59544 TaxID=3109363 RepID=UPI002FEF1492